MDGNNKKFYFWSLAVLAVLSAYPLVNGARMAYISISYGALEPEQYAKYVVPYAAICVSLLSYAALQPVFFKLKRLAFPTGMAFAFGVFFAVGRFFETMQIHISGMTLIDASALAPVLNDPTSAVAEAAISTANTTIATVDIWQAALCIASPAMREQSLTYASRESFYYVVGGGAYKIHYYLISLVLITMVCGLIYGITKMLRDKNYQQVKPIFLRGICTAALIALCIFTNTTAFFRQAAPIQTPLASSLTALFFVVLGAAAGVYAGSYLLEKGKRLGVGVPVLLSLCASALMYVGEAVMMKGNLYRFGTGWFFEGLPGIALAPVDVLIVLLSGVMTGLILGMARRHQRWPGKRTLIAAVAFCAAVAAAGLVIAMAAPKTADEDIRGCYVFDKNIYTHPASSFAAFGELPYIYGFDDDAFIIANTGGGGIQRYNVEYYNTPVGVDEFLPDKDDPTGSLFARPGLTGFKERYLLAVISDGYRDIYGLYRMDDELWLTELNGKWIWSIYRIRKTDATTLEDLRRVMAYYSENNPGESPLGVYANPPIFFENQMTLTDVFALARKGGALTLSDFEPFFYHLAGEDFTERLYEVAGADSVFVHVNEGGLESARLWSRRTLDLSQVIDLREGFEAVAEYLNPLGKFMDITIEDPHDGVGARELIYDYDYDQCRYYLNTMRADRVFIIFDTGERMPLKQALEERRIAIEDAVANGLYNVFAIPIDNPLGGEFTILHHVYTFSLNGEAFYPSKAFMYAVWGEDIAVAYYDIDEFTQVLEWYGYGDEAERLRQSIDPADIIPIARGNYVSETVLAEAGIITEISWFLSSHTPVVFHIRGYEG